MNCIFFPLHGVAHFGGTDIDESESEFMVLFETFEDNIGLNESDVKMFVIVARTVKILHEGIIPTTNELVPPTPRNLVQYMHASLRRVPM